VLSIILEPLDAPVVPSAWMPSTELRLWGIDTAARCGALDDAARYTVRLGRIRQHWEDMRRTRDLPGAIQP
jgi:hypothetical protein